MDRAEDRSNGGYNSGRRVPRLHDTNRRDTAPSCRASEPVRCSHAVPMGRAATAGGSSATREFVGAVALLRLIQGAPAPPAVRVMAGRQLHGSWTQLKPAVLAPDFHGRAIREPNRRSSCWARHPWGAADRHASRRRALLSGTSVRLEALEATEPHRVVE
jgi:hypothetical protein